MRRYKSIFFASLVISGSLRAEETPQKAEPTSVPKKVESSPSGEGLARVSGLYRLTKMEKNPNQEFVLHFEAEAKDGVHDLLVLKSEGLNVKIKVGQVLKLSAEVLESSEKVHEMTQVLLYLPSSDYGLSPIWLLSKAHETREMRGARYLEMHAPGSDYQVF